MGRVLISEQINACGVKKLDLAGHDVVQMETIEEAELEEKLKDADALLVRIMPVTRKMMEQAPKLKIISKHGVGVDNIDLKAARELGITVTTTPDANGLSVAEHGAALLMALAKNLVPVSEDYREIGFEAKNYQEGVDVRGKTLGLIGCGKIGRRMADICHYGFGMRVLVYDPYMPEIPKSVEVTMDRDRIFREADFVSIHCYLSDETYHSIGRRELSLMKPSAYFINVARGPVVEENALVEALTAGAIAGAGLDVTEKEPLDSESPLFRMPNVIVTPHYAPTTVEAATRVSSIAAENIIQFFTGGQVEGRVV